MSKKAKPLGDIISNEPGLNNFRKAIKEQDVISKFGEIFPAFSEVAIPLKLVNGQLLIKVENSVWRSELNLKRELLKTKINTFFEEEGLVKSIRFI